MRDRLSDLNNSTWPEN